MTCDCCAADDWRPLFSENDIRLGHCSQCDLHSIEEIPAGDVRMTEMEEGHYAGTQQVLDARRQLAAERVLTERFSRFVSQAQRHAPGGAWLDLGCGGGLLMQLAQEAGYQAEGIELNNERRQIAEEATGAPVHGAPVEDVAFPDDSFDVISMINVFSHLTSPARTFAELRRILRPGGVLVMATGEITEGARAHHMLNWNLGDHLHFLGDRTMEQYAERLGLTILEHERRWLPDEMFSREWLTVKGRSPVKNGIKTAIRVTPGGLKALRAVMLRRQAGSAAHSGVFVIAAA
ncbi:class I SAM-dependent methyltransferase [Nocardioides sp. AE5]|uniref:class I SAM-dependent methyltransferase n=1 Tax=Nocardioides sp. AE5 TaxID=2962573 RepID=UPI0028821E80|nr:class I SAM-dependent methyltransferase [Nocardioides sp. AE5]MDT0202583.1 class I SAM-dependent methyltransferase [Nocardioides sp. AE5]